MAVLSRPLPRLTKCGFSVCTFRPLPVSIRSRGLFCRRRGEGCSQLPQPQPAARRGPPGWGRSETSAQAGSDAWAQPRAGGTVQWQDAGAEGSLLPVPPAPGHRGEPLWEREKIPGAWAAAKRI